MTEKEVEHILSYYIHKQRIKIIDLERKIATVCLVISSITLLMVLILN